MNDAATIHLFNDDAYQQECNATIIAVTDEQAIILDRTVFYPTSGGQPGDTGELISNNGHKLAIANTIKGKTQGQILHIPELDTISDSFQVGQQVRSCIHWQQRYKHMRMHSALHLLCSVLPHGVTGCQIGAEKSRMDFNYQGEALDKLQIEEALNKLILQNLSIRARWVDEEVLDQNPSLVKTMSVQPPRGFGRVRLLEVDNNVDLQPCGGTHVHTSSEIGPMRVLKIENKGKANRRISIAFASQ